MAVLVTLIVSGAFMIAGFVLRLLRWDGNVNEMAQWALIGMMIPWVVLGAGCLLLLLRVLVYLFEVTAKRDLTGDGHIGKPVVALNPYAGRVALAADRQAAQLSQWETFVRGCETHTSWASWRDTINRETWQDWRDELMVSGWAEKDNPAQENSAWHLTAAADTILAALVRPA